VFNIKTRIDTQLQHNFSNISLFTTFSGVKTEYFEAQADRKTINFCEYCPVHCSFEQKPSPISLNKIGLTYFCPAGLSFLYAPYVKDNKILGYNISEPISYGKTADCISENETYCLPLSMISKTSRLLFALSNQKFNVFLIESLTNQLIATIKELNPEKAKDILNNAIKEFMIFSEGNFEIMKTYLTQFILMLYELIDEYRFITKPTYGDLFPGHKLSQADTLGVLTSGFDIVSKEFMLQIFPAAVYRHYALLQKATLIIRQNFQNKLTQNEIANAIFLSPSYFSKIFKEALGCTFNQYVNQVRIEKAKEMLQLPNIRIQSIPEMVGFDNRSYFGKIFKQLTGTTPGQYRNSILSDSRIK